MYDINSLDIDDLEALCKIITGKGFKTLFKQKPQEFAKIKGGFRPKSLSETEALNIAIRNINRPFIYSFVRKFLYRNLETIQKSIEYYQYLDMDKGLAIAKALSRSVFSENAKLYFKLINEDYSDTLLNEVQDYLEKKDTYIDNDDYEEAERNAQKNDEAKKVQLTDIEQGINHQNDSYEYDMLKNRLSECQEKMREAEILHNSELNDLRAERDRLQKELQDSQREYQSLKREYNEAEVELIDLRSRAQYEDTEEDVEVDQDNETQYDFISLCEADYVDEQGHYSAIRLADIVKGRLEAFHVNEEQPKIYENRCKIFYKDGPTERGEVGIWKWSAVQNKVDPSRDYVLSAFDSGSNPTEIIIINDCNTEEELLEMIKNGVEAEINTRKVLFSFCRSKNQYTGFLCKSRDIEIKGKLCKISKRVISLPRYDFFGKDLIHLSNGKQYHQCLKIGMPSQIVNIKNPLDIVRTIILSRSSWSIFKEKGKTRSEWKNITDLLERMDNQSIIDSIVSEAHCSKKEAQKMLNDFIENAYDYVGGTTIEDKIIAAVVSVNTELMDRCKALIMDDWRRENQTAIDAANEELKNLKDQIEYTKADFNKTYSDNQKRIQIQKEEAKASLEEIKGEHDYLQSELQVLTEEIESKEKLASDVENAVRRRIQQAQSDVAEFIASLSFVPQMTIEKTKSNGQHQEQVVKVSKSDDTTTCYTAGKNLNPEDLEENKTWNDSINTTAAELQEAGVIDKYALPFAAYLYSAYLNKSPLLMLGPNANAIVDAFSASIFGKTAGVLDCNEKYSGIDFDRCLYSEDSVVKIVNPFSNDWISRIPDIVSNEEKFFVAVYPFKEDIQIEPKSLYSYMLPVFTELVVDKPAAGQVFGGKLSDNYKEFKKQSYKKGPEKAISAIHTSLLVRTRIEHILYDMHSMLGDQNADYDMLFSLVPYSFATMQMPAMMEAVKSGNEVSKETVTLINGLFGENE